MKKTALVTSGSRGIGAAIVKALLSDDVRVAFTYKNPSISPKQLIEQFNTELNTELERAGASLNEDNLWPMQVDSVDAVAVQAALSEVKQRWGRLDILVNNAGIFDAKPIETFTLADYDHQMGVNTKAVFAATQQAAKIMEDGGRIINIGSNLADRVPEPGLSLYTMSKAAVWGLTKAVARELGPRGITVNIIQPGSTDTDMNPANGPGSDEQR